jgi:hypothetical protein
VYRVPHQQLASDGCVRTLAVEGVAVLVVPGRELYVDVSVTPLHLVEGERHDVTPQVEGPYECITHLVTAQVWTVVEEPGGTYIGLNLGGAKKYLTTSGWQILTTSGGI